MTETENLKLTMDAPSEAYSVERVNANTQKLDDFAGAVNTALSEKQGTLTFDSRPTESSINPVTSGGVYDALALKADAAAVTIPSGADMDTYTAAGSYISTSSSTTGTLTNAPTGVSGKGKTGTGSDGAGHVAIVEAIHANGSITTSESGYGATPAFWTKHRIGANWGQSGAYTYLGCIVNPAVETVPTSPIRKGDNVRWLQTQLADHGYLRENEIDGDFGRITLGAVCAFQLEHGLAVDGICGPATRAELL
ncbi:MAG: peptidoglycan-binding protein [Oscillospiraceae bacterium]|nr:peptidoglycan-binding protein [Oscillospiraceae bacterium]